MKFVAKLFGFYLNGLALFSKGIAGKKGFFLFCRPFAPKLKPHQEEFLATAIRTEDFIFLDKKVKVRHWGEGEKKVLLLHGWQSNSFHWKKYIEQFDLQEYSLIVPDAPAHGSSEGKILNVPNYAKLIKELLQDIGSVDFIIGHSIGGFSALHHFHEHTAQAHPPMVILAAPGKAEDFFLYFRDLVGLSKRTEKAIREYFVEWTGREVDYYSADRYAPLLNGPGMIFHDVNDQEVPIHYAETLHGLWEDSSLHISQGYGHRLKSEEIVEMTLAFVSEQLSPEPEPA